jgi:serine protease
MKKILPIATLLSMSLLTACGGGSDSSSNASNQPPTAQFSYVIADTTTPLTINFDANTSNDSDGTITNYSWDFADGNSATGVTTNHSFSTTGTYSVVLTVTDNDGASDTSTHTVQITTSVEADIELSLNDDGSILFDASNSQIYGNADEQTTIVNYQWDFGDNTSGTGITSSHTYNNLALYFATLTVTDSNGNTDSETIRTSFSINGTISVASSILTDIDVNDPSRQNINNNLEAFETNNSILNAQPLFNPVLINGFVNSEGSSSDTITSGNFIDSADSSDFYSVNLKAGQFVSLSISDYDSNNPTSNNVDLTLYDSNGNAVAISSNLLSQYESVAVTSDGDYFVQVEAINGFNKYVMNISNDSFISGSRAYGNSMDFVAGQIIVKMKSDDAINSSTASRNNSSENPPLKLSHSHKNRSALLHLDTDSEIQTSNINQRNRRKKETLSYINQLKQRTDIEYAEPNYLVHSNLTPNDDFYSLQSHYSQINLPQAWDITVGTPTGDDIIVAVVDNGVVLTHKDLDGQLVAGYDFVSDSDTALDGDGIDSDPTDPGDGGGELDNSWHGTHVTGTVAAASNNNQGVAGTSWGAKVMPVRVLGQGGGTNYDVEQGVRYAAGLSNDSGTVPDQPADIINLSLGSSSFSQTSQELYTTLYDAGIIVVAAAGNESTDSPEYPASYNNVFSISAVDLNNDLATYSNFGSTIDIAAPGGDLSKDLDGNGYGDGVLSTYIEDSNTENEDSYAFLQGTSMAAPHVAGVAALMKAVYPELTATEFDSSLQNNTLTNDIGDSGKDEEFGYGVIDALKAVQQAQQLAGGDATGSMRASPNQLSFGSTINNLTLTLNQSGSEPPSVTNISNIQSWLSITAANVDSDGVGDYTVSVDRTNLSDATYTDVISIELSNGQTLSVSVSMRVNTNSSIDSDAGYLYVLLLDPDTLESKDQFAVDIVDGEYNYNFTNVPYGEYLIIAGSDIDNDLFICDTGESCASYPTNEQLQRILIDEDTSNVDFLATIVTSVISNAETLSTNQQEAKKSASITAYGHSFLRQTTSQNNTTADNSSNNKRIDL